MCVRNFQFLIFNFQLIMTHYITPEKLTFEQIEKILTKKYKLALSDESKKLINDCKAYLDHKNRCTGSRPGSALYAKFLSRKKT